MIDPIEEIEQPESDEREPLNFEELLAAFLAKCAYIPPECMPAMAWLYVYRQLQDQRKRLANRGNQMSEGKRVFWGHVVSPELLTPMKIIFTKTIEPLLNSEEEAALALHRAMRHTAWYQEVAIVACRGVGMSKDAGTISAAKVLWAYGKASRFPTFGCIVRYSRLDPEGAAGKAKGRRIHYNPAAWQSLFDLSETWNRMPDCCWRIMWDAFKIQAGQNHPDWPKWKVHAWGRRKTLREFLRGLYETWLGWEARQA